MRRFAKIGACGYIKSTFQDFKHCNVIASKLFSTTGLNKGSGIHLELESRGDIAYHSFISQQPRRYAPTTSTLVKECWNCTKGMQILRDQIICGGCGHVQDVNTEINYFELMDLPQVFAVDTQALTKRFRHLQTLVHPDKFSNKSSREQGNSADWSALINRAYKTILLPLDRGQYLLKLKGLHIPTDNSALNKEYLVQIMERNEEVEEATTSDELNALNKSLNQDMEEKFQNLNVAFEKNELNEAVMLLVEMKYLVSIKNNIKNKLELLMSANN